MCAAFPRSEYYQRIRLRTVVFAFLRNNPYRPAYSVRFICLQTKTTVDLPGPLMLPSPSVPCSLTPPQSPATSPFAVCLLVPSSHYDTVGLRLNI
jgi:hypothetical protein